MGEAKLRGSFEERKAMAAERERKARKERAERERLARPKGKSRLSSLITSALVLSAGSFFPNKK